MFLVTCCHYVLDHNVLLRSQVYILEPSGNVTLIANAAYALYNTIDKFASEKHA